MPLPARARPLRLRALVLLLAVAGCACLLAALPARAAAEPSAVLALMPLSPDTPAGVEPLPDQEPPEGAGLPEVLGYLNGHPEFALGAISATQSGYSQVQALLDITAGTRTSKSTYDPSTPPSLRFVQDGDGGLIVDWISAVLRADSAPADITPGLLASSIPGGVGYVGIDEQPNLEAVAAANRDGAIPSVSIGPGWSVALRVKEMLREHRFVVALLPPGFDGDRQLDQLIADRAPDQLLIAEQAPPPFRGPQLLWAGIAGLREGSGGSFTSATTHLDGVAAGIDLLPTVLDHLGVEVPDGVRGQQIRLSGTRDAAVIHDLDDRLSVISARRMPALQTFLYTWLAVVLLAGIVRDRAGVRYALRLGGLAMMWLPFMVLVTAAFAPSRQAELFTLAGGCFLLALLTDRLVPWPRGPAVPAIAGLLAYAADLVNHSHLIIRSLLGPSPRSGSRFYGLGNELEIVLTVLLLIAIAAALRRRERTRGGAIAFVLGGIVLAAVMGSGRLGADVGGIFTVAGGAAVATLLMLPGGVTKKALGIAALTPLAGLAALAAIDLVSSGDGHFTRTVLHGSVSDQIDTFERRYTLAWNILKSGYAPLLLFLCILAVTYAYKYRRRIYGLRVEADPVWRACLFGGLGAAVSGSLFNDSGPVLLFIGVVALVFLTTYLRAGPDGPAAAGAAPPGETGTAAPPAPVPAAP
ncbi:hypothetical protein [Conexibacter arvalis]|uniref:Uncharacterized protein n=1 Tax=Conexibacter arvalis TaxID=912552 RepID=A0A840IBA1_9ACTN|nr:hypothetical protein [Conexibacter arvalis]MBB4661531.1 hypothetical protein [Conexibacter arvalis]